SVSHGDVVRNLRSKSAQFSFALEQFIVQPADSFVPGDDLLSQLCNEIPWISSQAFAGMLLCTSSRAVAHEIAAVFSFGACPAISNHKCCEPIGIAAESIDQ